MLTYIVMLLVSVGASLIGAICGVGGGIIIKPTLDTLGVLNVAAGSFLSGVTVLSMSVYSVIRLKTGGKAQINVRISTALAAGAIIGGITGKYIFSLAWSSFPDKSTVGMIQAIALVLVTLGTLLYTIMKKSIKTRNVNNIPAAVALGLLLGVISSFLGIGGGPVNIVVLCYFFSMETKVAAENSLYIILFSQLASLLSSVISSSVPEIKPAYLVLMILGGISGAVIGRMINKKIQSNTVDKLFMGLLSVIVLLNIYNIIRFAGIL